MRCQKLMLSRLWWPRHYTRILLHASPKLCLQVPHFSLNPYFPHFLDGLAFSCTESKSPPNRGSCNAVSEPRVMAVFTLSMCPLSSDIPSFFNLFSIGLFPRSVEIHSMLSHLKPTALLQWQVPGKFHQLSSCLLQTRIKKRM